MVVFPLASKAGCLDGAQVTLYGGEAVIVWNLACMAHVGGTVLFQERRQISLFIFQVVVRN